MGEGGATFPSLRRLWSEADDGVVAELGGPLVVVGGRVGEAVEVGEEGLEGGVWRGRGGGGVGAFVACWCSHCCCWCWCWCRGGVVVGGCVGELMMILRGRVVLCFRGKEGDGYICPGSWAMSIDGWVGR